jgi:hypothetical protein
MDLARNWANKLAPYRIVPLFPPRDIVEAGDIYIICERPVIGTPPEAQFKALWMTSLPGFQKAMEDLYVQRMELPRQNASEVNKTNVIDVPAKPEGMLLPHKWTRLGLVSFPEIFQVEGSVIDAGAAIPTGFAFFGLGGKKLKLTTYVLSMPAAEYQGLDVLTAERLVAKGLNAMSDEDIFSLADHLSAAKRQYGRSCEAVKLTYVRELFLARHMTLSYGVNKTAALAAQAKLYIDAATSRGKTLAAVSDTAPAAVAASAPPAPASNSSADDKMRYAQTVLAQAIALQQATLKSQVAGGQISYSSITDEGVSFDYSFTAPVAIGATLQELEVQEQTAQPAAPAPSSGDAPPASLRSSVRANSARTRDAPSAGLLKIADNSSVGVTSASDALSTTTTGVLINALRVRPKITPGAPVPATGGTTFYTPPERAMEKAFVEQRQTK